MKTFLLEIITPEMVVYSEQVSMVSAPSSDGVIGILAGHVPLFTKLIEGEVKIITSSEEFYLAIGGGFLEVTRDKVTLLVTAAYKAEELNEAEILAAKMRAQQALEAKPEGEALVAAQALFRRSQIALKVLKRKHRHPGE